MFYFRKEEVRNFFSFLKQLRKDRPWVFYTMALGLTVGLGLAIAALIFPAGTAVPVAIASYFNAPILANSPVLLAAVALDSVMWSSAFFAILLNWIIKGDTWRSINRFFHELSQSQPILNYGIVITMLSSIACSISSIFFPPASLVAMVLTFVAPALVEVSGLMATLFIKSTVDAIEDGIFSGSSPANNQRPVVAQSSPVVYAFVPVSNPYPAAQYPYSTPAGGLYVPMPAAQAYPGAPSSSKVDGPGPAYQPPSYSN